jgi:hypothetical protein
MADEIRRTLEADMKMLSLLGATALAAAIAFPGAAMAQQAFVPDEGVEALQPAPFDRTDPASWQYVERGSVIFLQPHLPQAPGHEFADEDVGELAAAPPYADPHFIERGQVVMAAPPPHPAPVGVAPPPPDPRFTERVEWHAPVRALY